MRYRRSAKFFVPQDADPSCFGFRLPSLEAYEPQLLLSTMPRQRHWVNRGEGGECVFITTTVLDFVHAFQRDEPRTAMTQTILRECKRAGVTLHAYVVMPHHIHLLARMPLSLTSSKFMQRFKTSASSAVRPLLTLQELDQFADQRGLNGNTFWQRSFRGIVISSERNFGVKVRYIHWNPVRAGYVAEPTEYRWSSAMAWEEGAWHDEVGLPL
jgi:putative transposase